MITAAYRAGTEALEVGGDWYDAFRLPSGAIGLVVGDVVGHGLEAAVAMGQLRGAVSALAQSARPAALLDGLDAFVENVPSAATATVAYVELDAATGASTYACAGHPPPLVVSADGRTRFLWDGRSAPLGSVLGDAASRGDDRLETGETLVLYTDGLIERRAESLDAGFERLAESATLHPQRGQTLADDICDSLLEGHVQDDDVCVLTRPPPPRSRGRSVTRSPPRRPRWPRSGSVSGHGSSSTTSPPRRRSAPSSRSRRPPPTPWSTATGATARESCPSMPCSTDDDRSTSAFATGARGERVRTTKTVAAACRSSRRSSTTLDRPRRWGYRGSHATDRTKSECRREQRAELRRLDAGAERRRDRDHRRRGRSDERRRTAARARTARRRGSSCSISPACATSTARVFVRSSTVIACSRRNSAPCGSCRLPRPLRDGHSASPASTARLVVDSVDAALATPTDAPT